MNAQDSRSGRGVQKTVGESRRFTIDRVADGVYAAIRKEPPGLAFDCNVVFIVNDSDVIVVDSNVTPSSAKDSLAALREITTKPVRYVINTHWHDDHLIGNQVYREAFPGVEFIGHKTSQDDLSTIGASNRSQMVAGAPELIQQLRTQVASNKNFAGAELTPEERASYLSDIAWGDRYLAEVSGFKIVMPTVVVSGELVLNRGSRTIEILHLGRAHTRSDLVVYLPKEKLAITGDIVVWPIPLIGSTSYPLDYKETLDKLLSLGASAYIPGHGPVLRDEAYVRLMSSLLDSLAKQVVLAVGRGEALEQVRKSVDLNEFREAFAGASPLKRFIFANYVTGPGVAAAFKQAQPPK